MIKRSVYLGIIISFLFSSVCVAKIESKKDADEFLKNYCIEIVAVIENQYEEQKQLASEEKWKIFAEKGMLITALADVYNKLCK